MSKNHRFALAQLLFFAALAAVLYRF